MRGACSRAAITSGARDEFAATSARLGRRASVTARVSYCLVLARDLELLGTSAYAI